jgi:hypothetical protein
MVTPLSDCTIEQQRAVVRFLWAEGVKSAEIHRRMLAQYGARTMHQRKTYETVVAAEARKQDNELRLGAQKKTRNQPVNN